MSSISVNDIEFPLRALSEMRYLRNIYANGLHKGNINISTPSLVSIRDFMNRFSSLRMNMLLPRVQPVRDIIPDDVIRWFADLGIARIWDLHESAYKLGYSRLFEVTSLLLSEDINIQTL